MAELADLGAGPAPEPSAELADLLGRGEEPAPVDELQRRRRRRRLGGTATVIALIAATGTGWTAAAAHELPAAVHGAVSGLARVFDSSRPAHDQEPWGRSSAARKSPGRVVLSPTAPSHGTLLRPRSQGVRVTPAPVPSAPASGTGGAYVASTPLLGSVAAPVTGPTPGPASGPASGSAGDTGTPAAPSHPGHPAHSGHPGPSAPPGTAQPGPGKGDPVAPAPVDSPPTAAPGHGSSEAGLNPGGNGADSSQGLVNANPGAPGHDKGAGAGSGPATGPATGKGEGKGEDQGEGKGEVEGDPAPLKPGTPTGEPPATAPVKVPVDDPAAPDTGSDRAAAGNPTGALPLP